MLGVGDVGRLNERILKGELIDIILVSEALHEIEEMLEKRREIYERKVQK